MAVAADQLKYRRDGTRKSYPVAASKILYENTLAFIDSSGYLTDVTGSGANDFAGIVVKQVDNSGGSNGDLTAECFYDGDFRLTGAGLAQANIGDKIYASDNYTITLTASGNSFIGRLAEFVSSTTGWVDINDRIDPADFSVAGVADDTDLEFGDGDDAVLLWSTGDADNNALVLGLGDSNQALHITDKTAKATDWNVSADTHPTVYIHSNTTPATDYMTIGGHDGTTGHINVAGGTTLALQIAGATAVSLTAANLALGDASDTAANSLTVFDGGADKPGMLVLYSGEATGVPYYLWVDQSGDLRIHTAAPTDEDADGTVVGAQS